LGKQCADLCTPSTSQLFIATCFRHGIWREYVQLQTDVCRRRRDAMLDAFTEHLPDGSSWLVPQGGLFIWVTLPDGMDTQELFTLALRKSVSFVPGRVGFARPRPVHSEMRLNFSACDEERIREGIRRLGESIREMSAG
jgi:2-aminoadipate transaminase